MGEWSTKTPKYSFYIPPGEGNGYEAMNKKNNLIGALKVVSLIVTIVAVLMGFGMFTTFKDFARKAEVDLAMVAARDTAKAESERVYQILKGGQDALHNEMRAYHEAVTGQLQAIDKKLWMMNKRMGEDE